MIERKQTPYAVINVDIQNDFCPGGKLAVMEGDLVVPVMNEVNGVARRSGALVITSRDWHPEVTTHFAKYAPDGKGWPEHCVQGTLGADLHKDLNIEPDDIDVRKGMGSNENGYSVFEARDEEGLALDLILKTKGVRKLFVGGLATDYCVRATVLDGLKNGFGVYVIENGVRAVNLNSGDEDKAWVEMLKAGAVRINSNTAERLLLSADAFITGSEMGMRRRGMVMVSGGSAF